MYIPSVMLQWTYIYTRGQRRHKQKHIKIANESLPKLGMKYARALNTDYSKYWCYVSTKTRPNGNGRGAKTTPYKRRHTQHWRYYTNVGTNVRDAVNTKNIKQCTILFCCVCSISYSNLILVFILVVNFSFFIPK